MEMHRTLKIILSDDDINTFDEILRQFYNTYINCAEDEKLVNHEKQKKLLDVMLKNKD